MTVVETGERDTVDATRRWIARAVIGLGLCPFARAAFDAGRVRIVVSDAREPEALARDLETELLLLHATDAQTCETTLLVHPYVLEDFLEYNDFLDVADALLDALDLTDAIQVASFHPQYQFGDAAPGAIENYTNRSPQPMLHLLRQRSVERAVASIEDPAQIYRDNVETLRRLGDAGWDALWRRPSGCTCRNVQSAVQSPDPAGSRIRRWTATVRRCDAACSRFSH